MDRPGRLPILRRRLLPARSLHQHKGGPRPLRQNPRRRNEAQLSQGQGLLQEESILRRFFTVLPTDVGRFAKQNQAS